MKQLLAQLERAGTLVRLRQGFIWSAAGTVFSRGITLLALIAVSRLLGRELYGELGIIQSTVETLGVLAGFGVGLTATKHVAEFRSEDPARAGGIIATLLVFSAAFGLVAAAALYLLADWLAISMLQAPHLAGLLQVGAASVFFSTLVGAQGGILSGFEAFRLIARVNLVAGLVSLPLILVGTYTLGLRGTVWALAGSACVHCLLNYYAISRETRKFGMPLRLRGAAGSIGILWRFSLPAALAAALVAPVNWLCNLKLVEQADGFGQLGLFTAANQWFLLLLFLPKVLGRVVLPVLSEQLGSKSNAGAADTLKFAILANLVVMLPLIGIISAASPFIMGLYGETFQVGWPTLIIAALTAGLLAVQMPVGDLIAASGRMWVGFLMNLGWGVAFYFFTTLLIDLGALGLAAARLLAYVVHAVWTFWYAITRISTKEHHGHDQSR